MKRSLICVLLISLLQGLIIPPAHAAVDREGNMRIIFDYITEELNLTPAVACGILANVKAESNFDPEAIGDSGAAYGICQWNARRDTMIKFCEDNGYGSWKNIYGQLAYLGYELEHYKKSVGDYLKAIPNTAQGAYDAAYHFCYYYEIPANRTTKSKQRGTNAVSTYWRDYYGGPIDTYTITYDANGGTNAPKSQTKTEGIPTLITLSQPVRVGYSLVGWSLDPDAVTLDYIEYEEFKINADTTLYAVWERAIEADTLPDASVTADGRTFELYKGSFTWAYAESFARIKGGYLATIESESEYALVSQLAAQADGACWLGGKYQDGNWQWITGEAFRDEFADGKWAAGEPCAVYGPTERGRLAQEPGGSWVDLISTHRPSGFIVEYADPTEENFPMYEICVSSSLRMREGPGTGYETLDHAYPGEIITILDVVPAASYDWGWGYTTNGKTGWCAMNIPDYMVSIGGIDPETGIIYAPYEDGIAVRGYQGSADELTVPSYLCELPVIAVLDQAFTDPGAPVLVTLPSSVREISAVSMPSEGKYIVPVASDAHAAVSLSGLAYECSYPDNTLFFPGMLQEVHEDAFTDAEKIECVDLSKTNVVLICQGAFSDAGNLRCVCLPEGSLIVESGAFDLTKDIVYVVKSGSCAEAWALENGVQCVVIQ